MKDDSSKIRLPNRRTETADFSAAHPNLLMFFAFSVKPAPASVES
jgi:hypothetical protein